MEHTHIEIIRDGLTIGSGPRAKGDVVPVSLVGPLSAEHLVATGRAKWASPGKVQAATVKTGKGANDG